jgi:SAM-dependent methyltransferase
MPGTTALFNKYYYSRPDFVDGTSEFHGLCRINIQSGSNILEIGAGPANPTSTFLSSLGRLTGLDVSEEVESNKALAEWRVLSGDVFPLPSASFDACVSNYVLEHVATPVEHFREARRVLRVGGTYCFRTPNIWHYVTLGSRLLPQRGHLLLANRLRGLSPEAHDPYPTVYRCNSKSAVLATAKAAGFELLNLSIIEKEPLYGRASKLLFYPMLAWERLVNSHRIFSALGANLLVTLRAV